MKTTGLKRIIESTDSRTGRLFDLSIQALIVLSLVSFSLETLPDLTPGFRRMLSQFEIASVVIFTLEYLCRLVVADHKIRFVFSFFGIIDLLAIAPFYLATGLDLRAVRSFRLFRLIRVLKLMRYNVALQRFVRAFVIARDEMVLFLFATAILLYLSAVGIYYCERESQPEEFASVFHSLWWAVTTLTTVGYGDIYPVTTGGRLFTFFVLMIGLGVVSVPAGLVASALSKAREEESDDSRSTGKF